MESSQVAFCLYIKRFELYFCRLCIYIAILAHLIVCRHVHHFFVICAISQSSRTQMLTLCIDVMKRTVYVWSTVCFVLLFYRGIYIKHIFRISLIRCNHMQCMTLLLMHHQTSSVIRCLCKH